MRSRRPDHAVVVLLRQCSTTSRCQASGSAWRTARPSRIASRHRLYGPPSSQQQRGYQAQSSNRTDGTASASQYPRSSLESTRYQAHSSNSAAQSNETGDPQNNKSDYAVLGGGITGLASAYHLAREFPSSKITLYEGANKLGGWISTEHSDVAGGDYLMEHGPRTLRPGLESSGCTTLELIQDLGLQDELLTPQTCVADQNRFIYYPDRLVRMPAPGSDIYAIAWSIFTEQVFKGLLGGVFKEFLRAPRPSSMEDDSVANFFKRRLGTSTVGDNLISSMVHGIYAGDINQLSIKSLFPKMWFLEGYYGSMTRGHALAAAETKVIAEKRDIDLRAEIIPKLDTALLQRVGASSMYSFRNGVSALPSALESSLRANPNVTLKKGDNIQAVDYDYEADGVAISTVQSGSRQTYQKVISTVPSRTLSTLASRSLPSLEHTHSVTVMVVNLYYPDPDLLPEHGFGYLIPQSIPFEQNPERALGVIFSSDIIQGQDSAPGTKITVMLGGHWWDGFDSYPDELEGVAMARAVLKRHLQIEAEPTAHSAALNRNCIPQYTVGHDARMNRAHGELINQFQGKLAVAGGSYCGISVNDCIRSARDVVTGLQYHTDLTGLEHFTSPRKYELISPRHM